eukprot:CAMPEP_0185780852 /NCGR_PEP_ID=MMETSP1174-20130828/100373_1 /TAXON_ID=35687 /ORGANISM="Dictyocha speculum, Strain CCMP1381" /LENGTH=377 /DNA_ID=CAMNT_0028470571 /DNA_START=220 /DNA_END=1350 /DNA_ORIENTATION=+
MNSSLQGEFTGARTPVVGIYEDSSAFFDILSRRQAHQPTLLQSTHQHYAANEKNAEHLNQKPGDAESTPRRESTKERNRLNAKKSRMRLKNHQQNLVEKIADLTEKCRVGGLERQDIQQRNQIIKDEHRKLVQLVLDQRAVGCLFWDTWNTVLAPDFIMCLPVTPYRYFDPLEVRNGRRVCHGIEGMLRDVASLAELMLAFEHEQGKNTPGKICFTMDHTEEVQVANMFYSRWTMEFMVHPPLVSFAVRGFVQAWINIDKKLQSLSLHFDTLNVIKKLNSSPGFEMIPNTCELALQASNKARIITSALPPHVIEHVNDAWLQLFEYRIEEVKNCTLDVTDGPLSDKNKLRSLIEYGKYFLARSSVVVQYKKNGQPFW